MQNRKTWTTPTHTQSNLFCKSNELLLHLTLGSGGGSVGSSVVVVQQEERAPCNAPLEECMNANPSHLCNISTRGSTSSVYEYRHYYRSRLHANYSTLTSSLLSFVYPARLLNSFHPHQLTPHFNPRI